MVVISGLLTIGVKKPIREGFPPPTRTPTVIKPVPIALTLYQIDKPESKSQVQAQSQIEKGKRILDSGLSVKSYWPPHYT